ncbi:L-asparaginase [Angomonas deanei]|nr:L-asparaginase [Angomonas deanei]|eukprot:EPY36165.1 L-asparaginase [Angomonas deanei]
MLQKNDDLHKEGVPPYDVAQVPKLTLSADQGVEEWIVLAELIEKHYFDYDGFVVQNGSDGMVFTATALSFMLENLGKPVIFTGSLIPATRIYTDMKRNTILSLMLAACRQLSEVCILFDDKLYRANRTIKVSRASLRPYDSPHFPPLARMSGSLKLWGPLLRPQPHGRLQVMRHMHTKILCLQIGPYVPIEVLVSCIQHSTARALIVACYGSGNAPSRDGFMKQIMDKAAEKKMLVVVTSQNQYGKVNLSTYELGRKMLQAGAISAAEMTPQTTYVKLKYLFGLGLSNAEVRAAMESDLRGELFIANSKL